MSAELNNCRIGSFVLKPGWRPDFRPRAFEGIGGRYELAQTYVQGDHSAFIQDDHRVSVALWHEYRRTEA